MDRAFDVLTNTLVKAGMNKDEINLLLGRFLEEEAFDYLKCMIECLQRDEFDSMKKPTYEA